METKIPDLYEFLVESELQHYYNSLKNDLKITTIAHLKYATDEDLRQVCGLTRPEIRRLRKYYEKYYPHGYLNKIKRLLQPPAIIRGKDDSVLTNPSSNLELTKPCTSPSKIPNNKHIIPADAICVNKQLGTGEFGIVQQGVWTNGTERIQVAIKCLCRERMQSNPMEFLKEAAIMHSIEHENIVRLYGVVLDTESLMLVTELAHLRSLLECLKDSGLRVSFLTVPTLCEFAAQICNGMMYLENKRLIHRDLAARNILVFSKNKVKISDFGLSRALGVGKDYYQTNFNVNLKLPIAWCAPECINFLRFTNASDVWAYAVCLWEIFSYGFQPWAALTGHQILEAIDEPNYQRLERPECCPKEYYALMQKCWAHDAAKRPKFSEIYLMLPDMKPEQLKTVVAFNDMKKDYLMYRQGEIITVLDKSTNSPYWKGVLNSGKTGLFNPANTVAYLDSLPSSSAGSGGGVGGRDIFTRTTERASKRKLRTEMISRPQNDLKHTGHVGIDGAYFGDVAFLASPQNLPRQIVTPYKPSEDLEQTPLLLPPTPTSPDSVQTASGYFSESIPPPATSQHHHHQQQTFIQAGATATLPTTSTSNIIDVDSSSSATLTTISTNFIPETRDFRNTGFKDSNPFINSDLNGLEQIQIKDNKKTINNNNNTDDDGENSTHEYHEISDDDIPNEKVFDLGPSLLDEMDYMFKSMTTISEQVPPLSPDIENTNKRNELTELTSKLNRKNSSNNNNNHHNSASSALSALTMTNNSSNKTGLLSGKSKKKANTVKPISVKDEKILNQAIEIANEISAKSMTDLVSDPHTTTQSPKRKFSFRFPHMHHSTHNNDKDLQQQSSSSSASSYHSSTLANFYNKEKRNFSEEVKNVPDLQSTITEEHRQAYNNLVENPNSCYTPSSDLKSFTASTLPRARFSLPSVTSGSHSNTLRYRESDMNSTPLHIAPKSPTPIQLDNDCHFRPSTIEDESNPLRILRNKNFPIVKPSRLKLVTHSFDEQNNKNLPLFDNNNIDKDSFCESPSYLTNPEYTYKDQTSSTSSLTSTSDNNPIPLPPRDRNKIIPANPKRHVRKHPLIIPASNLQRTLNKVTSVTPIEEKTDVFVIPNDDSINLDTNTTKISSDSSTKLLLDDHHSYLNQNIETRKTYAKEFIENNFPATMSSATKFPGTDKSLTRNRTISNSENPTYENLEAFHQHQNQNFDDDKYFNECESILENDINKNDCIVMPSPTTSIDVVDNFPIFPATNEYSIGGSPSLQTESELKKSINYVSCEDLLEFAEKPKGRARGLESDEVRIMSKVLGKDVLPERCLVTLDFIDWDIHKAIKLCKLQNILTTFNLSLKECMEALQQYDWDLHTTALKLKTHK
uniref:non-specific protein-tyrosine kinase n=1 Tax=Corethrella appendiculata TaxID=1370023 RepID=W4VRT2_9DIPT